jgi:hypothetical protein
MRDQRQAPRHRVALPVDIEDGYGTGITHDVSVTGVLLEAGTPLPIGKPVRFVISISQADKPSLQIECRGRVLRVEACKAHFEIAVHLNSFQLETSG